MSNESRLERQVLDGMEGRAGDSPPRVGGSQIPDGRRLERTLPHCQLSARLLRDDGEDELPDQRFGSPVVGISHQGDGLRSHRLVHVRPAADRQRTRAAEVSRVRLCERCLLDVADSVQLNPVAGLVRGELDRHLTRSGYRHGRRCRSASRRRRRGRCGDVLQAPGDVRRSEWPAVGEVHARSDVVDKGRRRRLPYADGQVRTRARRSGSAGRVAR